MSFIGHYLPYFNDETPNYRELLAPLNAEAVLQLANDTTSLRSEARYKLKQLFRHCSAKLGLNEDVLAAMEECKAVVGGSFISWFFRQSGSGEIAEAPPSVKSCLELFVPLSKTSDFVSRVQTSYGDRASIGARVSRDAVSGDEEDISSGAEHYFENRAVRSVTKMNLQTPTGITVVLVMESDFASAVAPILAKSSWEDRKAMGPTGYFDFHYAWSRSLALQHTRGLRREQSLLLNTIISGETGPDGSKEEHVCYQSSRCPLTLRSTMDNGVRSVAFNDLDAFLWTSKCPKLLSQPPLRWRHGGACNGCKTEKMDSVLEEGEWCESGSPIL
ncbi:hypothetical protein SCHPADRAFT_886211 [Schizopora paradoxa]|uniref:Uncharacterized protein n=1 Tax=Schizopora paradoxa TaxID=27342 RepID=A0A0H2S9Z4_9AGAM|nr:hypothetical protein SCHPADRAFT_886211 [Schizopora paradoxa]